MFDGTIVRASPLAHLLADMPRGIIANEHEGTFALGRKVGREPHQEQTGDRTDRTPTDKAQEHLIKLWEVEPITSNSFRLWGLGGDRLCDEV